MAIDWEARRKGVGGSDVAAIMGLSPWRTAYDVWCDKVGEALPQPESAPMHWGTLLEPVIRAELQEQYGLPIETCDMLQHDLAPHRLANVDGLTDTDDHQIVWEIKTSRTSDGWGTPDAPSIPQHYLIQLAWYLHVLDFPLGRLAVLIGGSDLRVMDVRREDLKELEADMVRAVDSFWRDHVMTESPPPPQTKADIAKRWSGVDPGASKLATPDIRQHLAAYHEHKQASKQHEQQADAHMVAVRSYLEDAETLVDDDGKALATCRETVIKPKQVEAHTTEERRYRTLRLSKHFTTRMEADHD